jgi:hypothetical protein
MNNQYIAYNRTSKISIVGLAIASVVQMLTSIHAEGFALAFAAMYIVAEIKKNKYE